MGAALVLWALGASSAQALASARLTEAPRSGQSLRAGATTTLRFAVDEEIEEMEILLSLDGGETFPVRVSKEMSGGTHEITWRVPNLPTTRARLALRVGDEEDGEVIRDVSGEFTILADGAGRLESVRPFRGEWRLGEALEEMPPTAPFDAAGLDGPAGTLRALERETNFARISHAVPTCAPRDSDPETVEPLQPDRPVTPTSPRVPLNAPRRE